MSAPPQLRFNQQELLASHDYAKPQTEAGYRLHGGFDEAGAYIPPRQLYRAPAIENWTRALRKRKGDLLDADASLLEGFRYPNVAQSRLLLKEGLGQSFWNNLTVTGMIEGRGRILADPIFPNLQPVIVEDISEMGIGHLNGGLLRAHGLDEGGDQEAKIGGHDVMWFALRDLAFGDVDYPDPIVEPNIARPEDEQKNLPNVSEPHLRTVYFLLNLLLIEFRAEIGFATSQALLRDPDLFCDRRAEAEHAAEIVERIRTDETLHVTSLRLFLGEIRNIHFKTLDGGKLRGREVVDQFWRDISHWATVEQPLLNAERLRKLFRERIEIHSEAERVQREFDALQDAGLLVA
jgi:hypothetical protein